MQPVTKVIHLGGFSSSDYPVSGPSSASCNSYVTYTCPNLPGATNYAWFYPGNWTYVSGQGTNMLTLITPSSSGSGQVGVRVANSCDAGGSPSVMFTNVSCGFAPMATVSPNPASSTVTASIPSSASQTTLITEINIYDQAGNLKKHQKFNNVKTGTLNISNLGTGIYIIEIITGQKKESQQLQVLK